MRTLLAPIALLLTGCAVGPNYQRPVVVTPPQYRGAAEPTDAPAKSIADGAAFDLFHDPELTALLKTALNQNNDHQNRRRASPRSARLTTASPAPRYSHLSTRLPSLTL